MDGVLSRDKYSLPARPLINTVPRVCMMAEIRRGEEHRVALQGWAEFMAPSPQRNYLTSLLIKSARTASHYNRGLIYSVCFKLNSLQRLFMSVSIRQGCKLTRGEKGCEDTNQLCWFRWGGRGEEGGTLTWGFKKWINWWFDSVGRGEELVLVFCNGGH